MSLIETLKHRFKPLEDERIRSGRPFMYLRVECDHCPATAEVTGEPDYAVLAEKVKDWAISAHHGGIDACPKHLG